MLKKRAVNLTLEPEIHQWALKIVEKRHYTSLSVLVEELIRERYDQLFPVEAKKSSSSKSPSRGSRQAGPAPSRQAA
jgi:hypothetical protein